MNEVFLPRTAHALEGIGAADLQDRMRATPPEHVPYYIRYEQGKQNEIYGIGKCHLSKSMVLYNTQTRRTKAAVEAMPMVMRIAHMLAR